MKTVLTCLLFSSILALANAECGPNEVDLDCEPCAAINCGDIPPELCLDMCKNPGCYCKSGYLKDGDVCVAENECGDEMNIFN